MPIPIHIRLPLLFHTKLCYSIWPIFTWPHSAAPPPVPTATWKLYLTIQHSSQHGAKITSLSMLHPRWPLDLHSDRNCWISAVFTRCSQHDAADILPHSTISVFSSFELTYQKKKKQQNHLLFLELVSSCQHSHHTAASANSKLFLNPVISQSKKGKPGYRTSLASSAL